MAVRRSKVGNFNPVPSTIYYLHILGSCICGLMSEQIEWFVLFEHNWIKHWKQIG